MLNLPPHWMNQYFITQTVKATFSSVFRLIIKNIEVYFELLLSLLIL